MKALFAAVHCLASAFGLALRVPVLGRLLDIASSSMVLMLRCCSGSCVAKGVEKSRRPAKLLKLYDFEGCPYCRKVREALCELDLDVEIRPCPKESVNPARATGASRFRGEVTKLGLDMKFPVLVDENTGVKMGESEKIVEYLWATYGASAEPSLMYRIGRKLDFMPYMMLPMFLRPMLCHGMLRTPSKAPKQPLELWGFEASPFARLVREALCVLELPYVLRNVAHGSEAKRIQFREKYGDKLSAARRATGQTTVQVPFLRDPNTGAELLESAVIVNYLYTTYQDGPAPAETWLDFSLPGKSAAGHGKKE